MNKKEALEIVRKNYPHVGFSGSEFETALRELVPELKESKDERIRKMLIEIVNITPAALAIENRSELLAYLERQKEQKYYTYEQSKQAAEDCYYDKGYNTEDDGRCNEQSFLWGFEEGVDWCEQQKERKPVDLSEMMVHKEPYIAPVPIPIVADELQPVEWSDDFEENISILLHDKLTWHSDDGKMSCTVSIDDKTLKDIISGIWFYVGKEALKYPNKELNVSEWSEEDENRFRNLIYLVEHSDEGKGTKEGFVKFINMLKSLRPQQKQEWSEEDEKRVVELKTFIAQCNGFNKANRQKAFELIDSLRPRPHWKPSEEQMEWLESAVKLSTDKPHIHGIIISLYEQLKRL